MPLFFTHGLMLMEVPTWIQVDLAWIGSIDFSDDLRNLFLVRLTSKSESIDVQNALQRSAESSRLVGVVEREDDIELAIYSSLEDPFSDVALRDYSHLRSDCFVNLDDRGDFYRSFLLPEDFCDLSKTLCHLVLEYSLEGISCVMLILTNLTPGQRAAEAMKRLRALEVDEFADQDSDGVAISRRIAKLDLREQHYFLAQLYCISVDLGFELRGIEFDLRELP